MTVLGSITQQLVMMRFIHKLKQQNLINHPICSVLFILLMES